VPGYGIQAGTRTSSDHTSDVPETEGQDMAVQDVPDNAVAT